MPDDVRTRMATELVRRANLKKTSILVNVTEMEEEKLASLLADSGAMKAYSRYRHYQETLVEFSKVLCEEYKASEVRLGYNEDTGKLERIRVMRKVEGSGELYEVMGIKPRHPQFKKFKALEDAHTNNLNIFEERTQELFDNSRERRRVLVMLGEMYDLGKLDQWLPNPEAQDIAFSKDLSPKALADAGLRPASEATIGLVGLPDNGFTPATFGAPAIPSKSLSH